MTSPETISMKTMKMFLRTQPPPLVFASRPLIDSSPIGLLGEIPSVTHEEVSYSQKNYLSFLIYTSINLWNMCGHVCMDRGHLILASCLVANIISST